MSETTEKTLYGLSKDLLRRNPKLVDEWDDDRIDDRILIDFLREVADMPIPYLVERCLFSEDQDQRQAIKAQLDEVSIDVRKWYPILIARAAIMAWEAFDEGQLPRPDCEDEEAEESMECWMSPKKALNTAIIWDRG